jgi:ribulose-5-phosphate 4-epimerase/fuculose-1-phosphate aldolase
MSKRKQFLEELVTANRILAREGIVDSFGHISVRSPENPEHFFMSRARAPDCIDEDDIQEFTLTGDMVGKDDRAPYLERFIHGSILEARADAHAVVHNHSPSVIPYGVTGTKIRPVMHMGASCGHEVDIWDSQTKFGDTNLLVSSVEMGRDLAKFLGSNPCALMRGHGSVVVGNNVRHAVFVAIYLEVNAKLQRDSMQLGEVKFLTKGEVDRIIGRTSTYTIDRAWENWCKRAEREFIPSA